MKFSYRVGGIIVLGLVAVIVLGRMSLWYWDRTPSVKHISTDRPTREPLLQESKGWSHKAMRTNLPFIPNVRETSSECVFSRQPLAKRDVCTADILQLVNDGVHASGTGDEVPPGIRERKGGKLKVIVVPHSHNDPGWHKTLEAYYEDQTKHILDNAIEKLVTYPKMKFVWAETVFLDMWWKDADKEQRATMRRLIENGQLEIVVGSWIVPDEANPHFYALVDQMITGHTWLERHLGVKPENTWSLDPFGYSSTLPYLYKRAGYDNMVILRVHEILKSHLIDKKALEFRWRQNWDTHGDHDIRTQMMPYKLYNVKYTCGPDHFVCLQFDFRHIPGEVSESHGVTVTGRNVERQAKTLLGQYEKKSRLFRHQVVLVPLGDDFRFDRSVEWDQQFKNYQLLFNHMNAKPEWNVEAKFGTIKDYFDEVNKQTAELEGEAVARPPGAGQETPPETRRDAAPEDARRDAFFPTLAGDFFPYTDERDEYWTGYFSTRPFDKLAGRELEHSLYAAELLHVLAVLTSLQHNDVPPGSGNSAYAHARENRYHLAQAHESLGLFQHHDAITGTARSYVASDYRSRLLQAIEICHRVMKTAIHFLLFEAGANELPPSLDMARPRMNIDIADPDVLNAVKTTPRVLSVPDAGGAAEVGVFNSLGKRRSHLVRLQVDADAVEVFDINGHIVPSQMNPVWTEAGRGQHRVAHDKFELLFFVDLQPTELRVFTLKRSTQSKVLGNTAASVKLFNVEYVSAPRSVRFHVTTAAANEQLGIENEVYRLRFSLRTGLLHSVTTKTKILTTKLNTQLLMYRSRGSGAYIFFPAGPAVDTEFSSRPAVRLVRGPLVAEVTVLQPWIQHRVALHNTTGVLAHAIEIKNMVDIRDTQEKELIIRFSTDIENSDETFWTDLNGFQTVKRKRYPHFNPEANYYPMTTMAYIEDDYSRLTLLGAQPAGVSSLQKGMLEVMLDRRLPFDDGRGLGEGVMDNRLTPSTFYLVIERANAKALHTRALPTISHPSLLTHILSEDLNRPPVTLSIANRTIDIPKSTEFLGASLPCDISLLSLREVLSQQQYRASFAESKMEAKMAADNETQVALLLHRKAFDCDFPSANVHCTTNGGAVTIATLFRDHSVVAAKETTLTLTHEKQDIDPRQPVRLHQMNIYTYKLTFGKK